MKLIVAAAYRQGVGRSRRSAFCQLELPHRLRSDGRTTAM